MIQITGNAISRKELRAQVLAAEDVMSKIPGALFRNDCGPLRHNFADGLYVREYIGFKGMFATSRLHKTTHPYFVLIGDATVITEEGRVRIKAPHYGITKAGTKRLLYFHEDTVWITVHATEETDVEKIEESLEAKTYDDLPDEVKKSLGIESEEHDVISSHSSSRRHDVCSVSSG